MKKIGLIIWLVMLSLSAFGQQFLWSTVKDSTAKYVPLEKVTSEVLEFYDLYKFYFDASGFSKDGFFEFIEEFGGNFSELKDFKKRIYEIEELSVFAFRANLGRGSVVLVASIDKKDINMIVFSNAYEADFNTTYRSDREKFASWYGTLLNYPTANTGSTWETRETYRSGIGISSGDGMGVGSNEGTGRGIGYGSGNRAYINIPDVNINENGVIYIEVHVTEKGDVINARILSTAKYPTNITNAKTQQECLARALSAKYVSGKEEMRVIVFK